MTAIRIESTFIMLMAISLSSAFPRIQLDFESAHMLTAVQPGNKFFIEKSSSFELRCIFDNDEIGEPRPTLKWIKKGRSVGSQGTLTIENVDVSNSGLYECLPSDRRIAGISIQVFVSTSNIEHLGPISTNESLLLSCSIESPIWSLNGVAIDMDENVMQLMNIGTNYEHLENGAKLRIKSPTDQSTGVYMCFDGEKLPEMTGQMFTLVGKPYISGRRRLQMNFLEHDNAVLTCDTGGFPLPIVKWQKVDGNDSTFATGRVELSQYNDLPNAMLTIVRLNFSDNGPYLCSAKNQFGTTRMTVIVSVKDKFAALFLFLGIVVEVSTLLAVVFMYERRCLSKNSNEQAVVEEDLEQKEALTAGESSIDIRQCAIKT